MLRERGALALPLDTEGVIEHIFEASQLSVFSYPISGSEKTILTSTTIHAFIQEIFLKI